ncbi:hypothetical protein CC80DRAFT_497604 [Byssothecium circinans]|uniref:Uncharacterized protein n=1 Tax=Byssothecium circinans TaxID=147558 RepID=A0A6A5TC23_9PLEO|nr:hypothetical protein CC80DRAFT_497604 [Byssothecium circinans]
MAPPTRYSPTSNDSMQKYMALLSEQEVLRRRLSLHTPATVPTTSSSPEFRSMAPSPIQSRPIFTTTWGGDATYATTASNPIPAQPGSAHRHSIADTEDAHKLAEVSQEIKAILTELLNTESCRTDGKYRQWIQGRLMDTEHEIRQQRRRRSTGSSEERVFASSIAEHLDLNPQTCKTWS